MGVEASEHAASVQRLKRALVALEKMQSRISELERAGAEPIAIVGIGARMPGGTDSAAAFWELLAAGIDATSDVPPDRWDVDFFYDPDPSAPGKMYTRRGAFVGHLREFDAPFFRISPREANSLDPQQRLALEVGWEALENAGVAPDSLAGSLTGVFLGIASTEYFQHLDRSHHDENDIYVGTGNTHSAAAGRISFILGLQGPSIAVDTACSSSLVSVHLACQSLRSRECDLALAGGVNRLVVPQVSVHFSKVRALSRDGRCKTFDASADGYGRGEGCGFVVLKRLSDAVAHRDHIHALIAGSAVNHDGASSGLTVPSAQAQQAVIRGALERARIRPDQVSYVEAHGTGTPLGDPIEVRALQAVFGKGRSPEAPLVVGSVKTNIGHLEPAAGIAGLIKTVLALEHGEIPAHLHVQELNPHVSWTDCPLVVPRQKMPWPGATGDRFAGVSAFGFSGTNAHVIVQGYDAPASSPPTVERPLHVLALSARTQNALGELVHRYRAHLESAPDDRFADVCFTANAGRSHFQHRLAVVVDSRRSALEQLRKIETGEDPRGALRGDGGTAPRVAFLFTGQGSQHRGMGRALYDNQPAFRRTLDECDALLEQELQQRIVPILYGSGADAAALDETGYTQPILFSLEYALAQLWRSWGVEPAAVIGHSIGEYVAACIAGVFSLPEALRLVAARGRLMGSLPAGGGMFAVLADESTVGAAIREYAGQVSIAAVNGASNTVISGTNEALGHAAAALKRRGITSRRLNVSHAFHSPSMDPILARFRAAAGEVRYATPRIALVSNVFGRVVSDEVTTAEYWVRQLREPVRFGQGIGALAQQKIDAFLEVGPATTLLSMSRQGVPDRGIEFLATLNGGKADWQTILTSLAALYARGASIDWEAFDSDYRRHRVELPTYPFQRQTFWIDAARAGQPRSSRRPAASPDGPAWHPLLGRRVHLARSSGAVLFESALSQDSPEFLRDHRVHKAVVAPAAGFIEMALAAASYASGHDRWNVTNMSFQKALVLGGDEITVQCWLANEEDGRLSFEISSARTDADQREPTWARHVTGGLTRGPVLPEWTDAELASVQARREDEVPPDVFYAKCHERGIDYGPSFRALRGAWHVPGGALGHVELSPAVGSHTSAYRFHPALLDACLQPLGLLPELAAATGAWIPLGLERLVVLRQPGAEAWSYVRSRPRSNGSASDLHVDALVYTPGGELLAVLENLHVGRLSKATLAEEREDSFQDWFYDIRWQPEDLERRVAQLEPAPERQSRTWIVLADSGGTGRQLAGELRRRGDRCSVVSIGDKSQRLSEDEYLADVRNASDLTGLFRQIAPADGTDAPGVVYMWSLNAGSPSAAGAAETPIASRDACVAALHVVQALVQTNRSGPLRLWIVTRGAVPVGAATNPLALAGSALWGLGKVVALEHPELQCVLLDLDVDERGSPIPSLVNELRYGRPGEQVAIRGGKRFVARLARSVPSSLPAAPSPASMTQGYSLAIASRGTPDNLRFVRAVPRPPGRQEVQVRVEATGLNFADVMDALGLLPFERPSFGVEFAGEISGVGDGVEGFAVGDRVFGAAAGSFDSHVTLACGKLRKIPDNLGFEDAATITVAFATAYYALHHVAGMKPGDKVLIHAAAGGVGLAAVQLAQLAGAEVFGTAHPDKWERLKDLGVQHVVSSRTPACAEQILSATGGTGVDIVLNSLTGEMIPASLGVLRPGGSFVEIGKRDIWTPDRMAREKPGIQYSVVDLLGMLAGGDHGALDPVLDSLLTLFANGQLRPLPRTVFPLDGVVPAFRYMQQARHFGKVVLAHRSDAGADTRAAAFREDATYLIVGGMGGLGLVAAEWLVTRGARHVVLMGRHAPAGGSADTIRRLEGLGAQIVVLCGDVAKEDDVRAVLGRIEGSLPPLRGIIHSALALDDAIVINQDAARFDRVFAPKVDGAWLLHTHTIGLDLDFFILFSAGASLLGNPGQANYAAANAFLDSLAHERRARGLAAMSINWGPWSVGAAAARGLDERMRLMGLSAIDPEQGVEILDALYAWNPVQIGVLPIRWREAAGRFAEWPLVSDFRTESAVPAGDQALLRMLDGASPDEKRSLVAHHVRAQIAGVLGLEDEDDIPLHKGFFDLGMDSLTAVELRNKLQATFGCTLPPTLAFDYPTVGGLIDFIARDVLAASEPEIEPTDQDLPDADVSALLGHVEGLSDADALALLKHPAGGLRQELQ